MKKAKKVLIVLFIITTLYPVIGAEAAADQSKIIHSGICGEDLNWTIDNYGVLEISGYGPMDNYDYYEYDEQLVLDPAPWYDHTVYSVVINEGVTSIGRYAFYNMSKIESVRIADSVTSIGYDAFYRSGVEKDSKNLIDGCFYVDNCLVSAKTEGEEYTVKEGTRLIADYALSGNKALRTLNLPDSIKAIDPYVLDNTEILKNEAYIENGVFYLGKHLISASTSLSGDYAVKEGTLSISPRAFQNCTELKSLSIPDTVKHIGSYAFDNCTSLTHLRLPSSLKSIERVSFANCKALSSILIPDSVEYIAESSFYGCSALKSLTLPNSCSVIGGSVFYMCTSLEEVTLTSNLIKIGEYAFRECSALKEINIPSSVTDIASYAFLNCGMLRSVALEEGITYIGSSAFRGCTSLESISLPDSLAFLGENAFADCTALSSVAIGNSLKELRDSTFRNCTSLTEINIPESITSIRDNVFLYTPLMGDNATVISNCIYIDNALIICNYAKDEYKIDKGTTVIASNAFKGLPITSLTVPGSVKGISYNAFSECTILSEVILEEGVERLEQRCFYKCGALKSVHIPSSLNYIGTSAFDSCKMLNDVYIKDLTAFCNIEMLSSPSKGSSTNLWLNGELLSDLTIPKGLKSLRGNIFVYYASLRSIVIPDDITAIPYNCFSGCNNLEYLTIPASVTYIHYNALPDYAKLTIRCYENSAAHIFAQRNNFPFELIKRESTSFNDVSSKSWYKESVDYCTSMGYLMGTGNGKFSPSGVLTREQLVVILARMKNVHFDSYKISYFTDVKTDSWYGPAVIWANEHGYVAGVGARKFGVGQKMTREQLATVLFRYAQQNSINTGFRQDLSIFKDNAKISSWAKEALSWAVNANLIGSTSTSDMILAPQMTVTRAQAAKIFMNFSK